MADRYWVGGNGTWDASATTNWSATSGGASGASAPTVADNVFFDSASTPTPGVLFTVTLSAANCLNFTLNTSDFRVFGGTIFAEGSVSAGSATYTTNMTIEMRSSGAQTVDVRIPLSRLRFNGTGTFDLAFDLTQTTILDLTKGTITSSTGALWYARNFVSSSLSTRAIAAGVSIQLTGAGRADLWVASSGTFTCDGQIYVSDFNNTFAGGDFTYAFLFVTSGSGTLTITGNNTFRQFTGDNQGGSILSFPSGGTNTIGTFYVIGQPGLNTTIRSASGATTLVFRKKPKNIDYLTFQGVTASPSGVIYAGANSVDSGSNSGINFSAWIATDFYWIGGTGDWTDGTDLVLPNYLSWSNSSGGASYAAPNSGDNIYFDANSDAGTSFAVTRAASIVVNVFSILGIDQAMSFSAGASTLSITGNFTLTNTGLLSWSSTGLITFGWVSGTNAINTDYFPLTNGITFTAVGGLWQLASPFQTSSTAITTLTSGTLSLQNYSYDTGSFTSSNSNVRSINFGTGSITLYNSGTIWNTATTTNLSISGTPLVASAYSGISPRVITPGALAEASTISFWFLSGGGTVTITAASRVKSLDFNGFTGTLANTAISIYGGLQLSSAMTLTAGTSAWTFAATSGSWTITSSGKVMDFPLVFGGTGGAWSLGDALTTGTTRTITLTFGSISLNGYTLTAGLFSSNSSNIRAIDFGSAGSGGSIAVTGVGTVWNTATATNLTASGSQIVNITNSSATSRTISPGAPTEANAISFNVIAGTGTVTLTASSAVRSVNFTGFAGAFTIPLTTVYGSWKFSSGMTVTGSGSLFFNATSGSHTITSSGKSFGISALTFGGGTISTATWALDDAFTTTGALTLTSGTFTTNNYNITATSLSSSNSNTRTINLGISTVTLSLSGIALNFSTQTGLTFNAGTSSILFSGPNAALNIGTGVTFYNVSLTSTAITNPTIVASNTFNNLTVAGRTSAGIGSLLIYADQTINGTLTLSAGANATARTFVSSHIIGTTRTLTCAAVASLTDIDFRDITIAGAAAPVSGTRLSDCKGNSGITFDAAKTVYWRLNSSTNWSSTAWALTAGGLPSDLYFPLAQDTAVFTSGTPPTGATITINAAYNIGTIDMSARTSNTMTLATGSITPTIYGNWLNGTGTTLTGTNILTFAGRGSQTITSAGKTFTQAFSVQSTGGSVTLQDALTSINSVIGPTFDVRKGTLDLNNYNLTQSGNSVQGFSLTANPGDAALVMGSGNFTIAAGGSATFNNSLGCSVTGTGTISFTSSSAKTIRGGGIQTYPTINQGGTGALTITGSNKFANITNTAIGSVLFTGGTTNAFAAFNLNGILGNLLVLGSTDTTQVTLKKFGDWNVGAGSTDGGNNTGLSFTGTDPNFLNISYVAGTQLLNVYLGSVGITSLYYGGTAVSAIYYGSNRVF